MEHLKKELEREEDKEIIYKLTKPNPSLKDLADIMKHVIDHMWSEKKLAQYINQVHDKLCSECPHMKSQSAGGDGKMSGKMLALIGSLVTAVVTLAGVVVKLATGG